MIGKILQVHLHFLLILILLDKSEFALTCADCGLFNGELIRIHFPVGVKRKTLLL